LWVGSLIPERWLLSCQTIIGSKLWPFLLNGLPSYMASSTRSLMPIAGVRHILSHSSRPCTISSKHDTGKFVPTTNASSQGHACLGSFHWTFSLKLLHFLPKSRVASCGIQNNRY
jgi:hypothetical protein